MKTILGTIIVLIIITLSLYIPCWIGKLALKLINNKSIFDDDISPFEAWVFGATMLIFISIIVLMGYNIGFNWL